MNRSGNAASAGYEFLTAETAHRHYRSPSEQPSKFDAVTYILADNRLAETSTWDEALLKIELGELGEIGLDFDAIGFDLGDIGGAELDDEAEVEPEAQEDDYDGSVPETTKVKRGDVYALGRHRLMCGDATSFGDVQVLMRGGAG